MYDLPFRTQQATSSLRPSLSLRQNDVQRLLVGQVASGVEPRQSSVLPTAIPTNIEPLKRHAQPLTTAPTPRMIKAAMLAFSGSADQVVLANTAAMTTAESASGTSAKSRNLDPGNLANTLTKTSRKAATNNGVAV
jgi:hypothetical protein